MPATVRAPRVYEQIVGHIERAIYEGRLRQGQKLPPERQLARDLKASRVAVREALRTLELRGLVDVRQGSTGGYFVREVDDRPLVRDFETLFRLGRVSWSQLVEARRLIEPEVAALAAQRATEVDIKNLGAALEQHWEQGGAGLPVRASYLEFHRVLAEAARNPVHAVITHALIELEAEVLVPSPDLTEADNLQVDAGPPPHLRRDRRRQGGRGAGGDGRAHRRRPGPAGARRRHVLSRPGALGPRTSASRRSRDRCRQLRSRSRCATLCSRHEDAHPQHRGARER